MGKAKKIGALALVFLLLALTQNLIAKERKGSEIEVEKKDGSLLQGELIAVKQNSILLLENSSGADVSVNVSDINAVKFEKKSRPLTGLGIGLLAGGVVGALVGFSKGQSEESPSGFLSGLPTAEHTVRGAAIGLAVGGLGGLIAGSAIKTQRRIQFEGKSPEEVRARLEKLSYEARVTDFIVTR